mmetsp:Transcript_494/g.663  ORF Transcript_494/g.663 Transcript_494/m.663 type:complete len:110 (+) Transcript_494:381-710(+)
MACCQRPRAPAGELHAQRQQTSRGTQTASSLESSKPLHVDDGCHIGGWREMELLLAARLGSGRGRRELGQDLNGCARKPNSYERQTRSARENLAQRTFWLQVVAKTGEC